MTDIQIARVLAFGILYALPILPTAIAINDRNFADAFWWPLHLLKALTKSLFRVLFTGWRL
jgi:hypothetical protein